MGEGEGCENRKSDVASLGRKLKLHLLVYIIDKTWIRLMLYDRKLVIWDFGYYFSSTEMYTI